MPYEGATNQNWKHRSNAELIGAIRQAGILGMGGGGFPAADKIELAQAHQVDCIVANAVECEPGIYCDEQLLIEQLDSVLTGLEIVAHLVGNPSAPGHAVLAYAADFSGDLVATIDARLPVFSPDTPGRLSQLAVTRQIGAGAERQLSQLLFQRPIPPHQYPIDQGVLCFNVATLHAIAEAVVHGRPLTQRLVSIDGSNQWLTLGTPMADVYRLPSSATTHHYRVGGHYTGQPVPANAEVTATTNALWHSKTQDAKPCTQCGLCADACPAALLPQVMLHQSMQPQVAKSQATPDPSHRELDACIDCGLCNAVCPSHIDLLGTFKSQKQRIRQQLSQEATALRSHQRFARHQARLSGRTAAAEDRRRQRRQQRLSGQRDW